MVCVTIGMARISTLTTQWLCVPCLCKHLKPFTCNGGTKNHNSTNKTAIVTFVVEDPYHSENYDNSLLLPLASVSMSVRDLFPCVWYPTQIFKLCPGISICTSSIFVKVL